MEYIADKINSFFTWIAKSGIHGIVKLGMQCEDLFMIAAIIGIFLTMAGAKKKGTTTTSISIFIYLLIKALSNV